MVKTITGEEVCEQCNSPHNEYNPTEGFYTCLSCGAVWAYDEDDPDYDDDDEYGDSPLMYGADPQ
jgi:ribosomal protein L37AE/L43A